MSAVQFCPSAPHRNQGLMLYLHESFFCFYSLFPPNLPLVCGGGFHVSVRFPASLAPPYAFSFLPCIWTGAPAYAVIQRYVLGQHDARRLGTHTGSQGCGRGQHDAWRSELVAGASFIAGAAGVFQEGATHLSPHPSFQKRQGKTSWSAAGWPSGCGSFLGPRARDGTPAPRVRGFFGFCFLGIRDRSGAAKMTQGATMGRPEVSVPLEVRHG